MARRRRELRRVLALTALGAVAFLGVGEGAATGAGEVHDSRLVPGCPFANGGEVLTDAQCEARHATFERNYAHTMESWFASDYIRRLDLRRLPRRDFPNTATSPR